MNVIFVLSFFALVSLWGFTLIGLVNPKKFQKLRKSKPITRLEMLLVCFFGTIILLIIGAFTVSDPSGMR